MLGGRRRVGRANWVLNVECIALAYARAFACYAGAAGLGGKSTRLECSTLSVSPLLTRGLEVVSWGLAGVNRSPLHIAFNRIRGR